MNHKNKKVIGLISLLPFMFSSCVGSSNKVSSNQDICVDSKGNKVEGNLDLYLWRQSDIKEALTNTEKTNVQEADAVAMSGKCLNMNWKNTYEDYAPNNELRCKVFYVNVDSYRAKSEADNSNDKYYFNYNGTMKSDVYLSLIFQPRNVKKKMTFKGSSGIRSGEKREGGKLGFVGGGLLENEKIRDATFTNFYTSVSLFKGQNLTVESSTDFKFEAYVGIDVFTPIIDME